MNIREDQHTPRHSTGSINLANYLYHLRHEVLVMIAANRSVFAFIDSPRLRDDLAAYDRAMVSAVGYGKSGPLLFKIVKAARQRHHEWQQRMVAGADVSQVAGGL